MASRTASRTSRRSASTRQLPAALADLLPGADFSRRLRRRLLAWFGRHGRDLPWRGSADPYHVWVSEIMLQQTQVATVESYFPRFIERFPTIADLAAADEQEVLRLWEGLGYYRRARQLHRAAGIVLAEHGGNFPRDFAEVVALPGIGRYTAGAILSIAFDDRHPILEANTLRLYSRLLAFRGDPRSTEGERLLWAAADRWLPRSRPGRFNEALMDLGAGICLPGEPRCDACPLAGLCPTRLQGLQDEIPPSKAQPRIEQVREAAVVVRRRGKVLVLRRGDGGRWAGLWDFPRFPLDKERGRAMKRELESKVRAATGVTVEHAGKLTVIKHGVTRFRITLECYEARYVSGPNGDATGGDSPNGQPTEVRWVRPTDLADYPLSVTGRKISRLLLPD